MSEPTPLSYERQPPAGGNTLIDEQAGGVFIRFFPDHRPGRFKAKVFVAIGFAMLLDFLYLSRPWSAAYFLAHISSVFAPLICFGWSLIFYFTTSGQNATIFASYAGVEYAVSGLAARMIHRWEIAKVITRDDRRRRASIGLRLVNGSLLILGSASTTEIERIAEVIECMLNSEKNAPQS